MKQTKINKGFLAMALFSFLFLIFMIINDSITSWNWTVFKPGKEITELKPPVEHVGWITIFYFTFQSNLLVFVYLLLRGLGIMKPKENKKHKIFQLVTVVNITITMVIYWTVLAPFSSIWTHGGAAGVLKRVNTILIHFVAPVFMLIAYHFDKLQKGEEGIILYKKDVLYVLIYPIVWIILAIIVYYSTREEVHYSAQTLSNGEFQLVRDVKGKYIKTIGVAIYFFLSFDQLPAYLPIVISFGIAVTFVAFGFLFIALSNPDSKLNSIKIKRKKQD